MTFGELAALWDENGDTVIDQDFGIWKKGTSREAIWMWFDERCPNGVVRDLVHIE